MAIIILPDAQAQLLALQEYMLNNWSEGVWLKAEDEIFEKLEKVNTGEFTGTVVQELATVGILNYRNVYTSHHKLVYRSLGDDTYVYLIAGLRQDYPALFSTCLLNR